MDLNTTLLSVPVADWRTRQAVVLDWYDGPREGVCALAEPDAEFYFDLLDERRNDDDLDDRLFRVSAIPAGSVDRLLAGSDELGHREQLPSPVWVPLWRFDTADAKRRAEELVETIRHDRRSTDLVIATRDMVHFLGSWKLTHPDEAVADWFAYLGAAHPLAS